MNEINENCALCGKLVDVSKLHSRDRNTGRLVHRDCGTKAEMEVNESVISAAPEMLSVLIEIQESASYWSEYDVPLGIVDRINAVIAKANGMAD